jgi:hypothetical protein
MNASMVSPLFDGPNGDTLEEDVTGYTVSEILLFRIATHFGEGQNGNRRPIRGLEMFDRAGLIRNRLRDVPDRMFSQRLIPPHWLNY